MENKFAGTACRWMAPVALGLVLSAWGTLSARDFPRLLSVRHETVKEGVRIELAFSEIPDFKQFWSDRGTYFIFSGAKLKLNLPPEILVSDAAVKKVRLGVAKGPRAVVALDIENRELVTVNTSRAPQRINILVSPKSPPPGAPAVNREAAPAPPATIRRAEAPVAPEAREDAGPTGRRPVNGERLALLRSEHLRLELGKDVSRIAVGDPEVVGAEPIGAREILVLGKRWGNSSLIVWFKDGTVSEHRVWVMRDLQLLAGTLRSIDSRIRVEAAADRDAIVLTGTVRDLEASQAATRIAQNYLDASRTRTEAGDTLLANAPANPENPGGRGPEGEAKAVRVSAKPAPVTAAVINMLTLETLPPRLEERIRTSLEGLGSREVTVRRIQKGAVADDEKDVFVLEGTVQNQVQLTRVLLLAAQSVSGRSVSQDDLRVLADESGALLNASGASAAATGSLNAGGAAGGLLGNSGGNNRLMNQVGRNLGRAKAIEVAGGRVLSFLHVRDLPQVRVNIRLYEVNRNKLRGYNTTMGASGTNRNGGNLPSPLGIDSVPQGGGGGARNSVEGIISFIAGSLNSAGQFASSNFAIDAALSLLERQGIARSLSSPSLTVLSGEMAQFQVGGQIPLPQAFIPAQANAAAGANGVYSSVVFEEFGVRLAVRPLVDDADSVTLDVMPQIITPNADLTASIRNATGTNQLTSAFSTRSLRTSARLADGQALLVGGLLSREASEQTNGLPGVQDLPGIGKLFRNFNRSDNAQELIVVVNPVVLRDTNSPASLWAYPEASTLIPAAQTPSKKQ